MNKFKIGITSGDINGIGLEVILKTLSSHEVLKKANFYLFCSTEIIKQHQNYLT
jgi:4-hydroxythreonine-4-phosphate dehydrogenase